MTNDVSVFTILDFNNVSKSKSDFFHEVSFLISGSLMDEIKPKEIESAILEREILGTTGFGNGLAIPHGKVANLKESCLFYVRCKHDIEWDSLDEKPAKYIFIILVASNDESNNHLKILSKLSYNLMDPVYQEKIKNEKSSENLRNVIEEMFTD